MSAEDVITVKGLGKKYRLGPAAKRSESMGEALWETAKAPFRYLKHRLSAPSEEDTFWALRDVSFSVRQGEVVGIIGANGAGKSTLLKILSRITDPAEGRVMIKGRVNSLLEVGVGFHPELTGRENIFLSASLHGLSRMEIRQRFDEIVDFSGVEKFLDTPVKRYSTGMSVRLGFAVAAHLDPDVLIVDEVLAVGDFSFQQKCIGKMSEVSQAGRTVLFVSHNMAAVQRLCNSGILLRHGCIVERGDLTKVIEVYLSSLKAEGLNWERKKEAKKGVVNFLRVYACDAQGEVLKAPLTTRTRLRVCYEFEVMEKVKLLRLGMNLLDNFGVPLVASTPEDISLSTPREPGVYKAITTFPKEILLARTYGIKTSLYIPGIDNYDSVDHIFFYGIGGSVLGKFFARGKTRCFGVYLSMEYKQTDMNMDVRDKDVELWTSDKVQLFWKYWATHKSLHEKYFARKVGQGIVHFLSHFNRKERKTIVLDYGCGPGYLIEHLLNKGFISFACDSSVESVQLVNKRLDGHPLWGGGKVIHNGQLDFDDHSFDVVTCIETIEHLPSPLLEEAFKKIQQLLKPGGIALFTTPHHENLDAQMHYCPFCDTAFHEMQHVNSFTLDGLKKELERAGFETLFCKNLNFANFQFSLGNWRDWSPRKWGRFYSFVMFSTDGWYARKVRPYRLGF